MKVAVSGVGGGAGQSVLKALSIADLSVDVLSIDVLPLSAGLFRAPEVAVLPKPESVGGLKAWESELKARGVDALIPGSDYDLLPLASVRDAWAENGVCQVLVSDPELVTTCGDKAETCQVLERFGLPSPAAAWDLTLKEALSWAKSTGFPVVLKPRDGMASRNVHLIKDPEELSFFYPRTPNPVLQEHLNLSGEVEEYTCAVFTNRHGFPIETFIARRDLMGGATYRAEVVDRDDIRELLLGIGTALKPRGVLNVQLRLTDRGPVPFELNARCSGTTATRAYFGYNEPEMLLRHYVMGEELAPRKIKKGYVFRYWNEIFVDDADGEQLKAGPNGRHGKILAWP